jgi:ceramide glucosyltransferase
VRPDYLRRVTAPFEIQNPNATHPEGTRYPPGTAPAPEIQNPPIGLVTCPYRGERAQSFAAIIEALGIGADFIPSTLVSRAIEGVSFALGSTIAIPRGVLEEIGGFEPLRDELADDFRLGNSVHKAGYAVVLSDYVIESVLGPERFSVMWSRRLRWSRTLRVCRPAGYAGSFIVYGFALALLYLVSTGFSTIGWAAFGVVTAIRIATALTITLRYTRDPAVLRFLPLLPISDVFGLALFTVSFFGSHILWRGERFRLLAGGRLAREE